MIKLGSGKINFSIILFAFFSSLAISFLNNLWIDERIAGRTIKFFVMESSHLVFFLVILSIALFPRRIPFAAIWNAPRRSAFGVINLFKLTAFAIILECIIQLLSAAVELALNSTQFFADVEKIKSNLNQSNIASLFFGKTNLFGHLILGPFVEEWIFRGVLLNYFLIRHRIGIAVLASSILFAALHSNFTSALLGGMFLGAVYCVYGRLWLCILLHGVANLFVIVVFGMSNGLSLVVALDRSGAMWGVAACCGVVLLVTIYRGRKWLHGRSSSPFAPS